MDKQAYVEKHLEARRKQWPKLARKSGVSLGTFYSLAKKLHSPNVATINAIYDAMRAIRPPRKDEDE